MSGAASRRALHGEGEAKKPITQVRGPTCRYTSPKCLDAAPVPQRTIDHVTFRLLRNVLLLAAALTLPPVARLHAVDFSCQVEEVGTDFYNGCVYPVYSLTFCPCPDGAGYQNYTVTRSSCTGSCNAEFAGKGCYLIAD